MWQPPPTARTARPAAALGVAALALALALGTAPAATPGAAAAAPPTPAPADAGERAAADPTARTASTAARTVTLVTGDRVTLLGDGDRPGVAFDPRAGDRTGERADGDGRFVTRYEDGDAYVIPADALPYLGRALDPALFNVSALVRAGLTTTPIRAEGGSAPRPGPAFGAALAKQAAADAAHGGTGGGTLFGGVTSVGLDAPADSRTDAARSGPRTADSRTPGPRTAAAPRAADPLARVTVTGADGAPVPSGTLSLVNVDDSTVFRNTDLPVENGVAEANVPPGHYTAFGVFQEYDDAGGSVAARLASVDFTVPEGDGGTDAAIDLAQADRRVAVKTPREAHTSEIVLNYRRDDAKGAAALVTSFGAARPDYPLYVQPTGAPGTGGLHFNVQYHGEAPASAPEPYGYDLKFDNAEGIAEDQEYEATDDQIATLELRYHSDKPGRTEGSARLLHLPYEDSAGGVYHDVSAPAERTEYVGGSPGLTYTDALKVDTNRYASEPRTVRPGTTTPVDWLRGPLPPGLKRPAPDAAADADWVCTSCRRGDDLSVLLSEITDSDGHYSWLADDVRSSHLVLTSGDTVLEDRQNVLGTLLTVPEGEAPYKLVYDQTRTGTSTRQSLVTHTEWTFDSGRPAKGTVPESWRCYRADGEVDTAEGCAALPLITAAYEAGAAPDGTVPVGGNTLDVTFGHAPGTADPPAVTGATVEVSFDAGDSWTEATTTARGDGRYHAEWQTPAPAAGKDVALRVSATDASGATLHQTVEAAFTVTATD
ncbi:hypothetical protein DVA86_08680 [Streptomyces armeniacus]|uniref:Uncharacterized protein n=1 Tax=Streptomyces armeniacus TaxID=83291 RepID=A0A345XM47_9ACTN|nr:hypothetical protein [Streptomyces armeniacus]AXK32713.1 hypothetical protein DVA86_08680 [Streptomyces armeniacus]